MFTSAASNNYAKLSPLNNETNTNAWIAVYDYDATADDELSLNFGHPVEVLSTDFAVSGDTGWWVGRRGSKIGVFPRNYIAELTEELAKFLQSKASHSGLNPEVGSGFSSNTLFCDLRQINIDQLSFGEFIGAGGFGKVYRGYFEDQEVAIKAAKLNSNDDISEVKSNVIAEARNFSLLNHKNIISLIGVNLQEPNLCIVLEYAEGGPLNRCLAGRQLPPSILVNWAQQIAEGMHYLHVKAPIHLVHRDLKSSNGMFCNVCCNSFDNVKHCLEFHGVKVLIKKKLV